jgi:hypothetical protein
VYNHSPSNFICIFTLFANTNEHIIMKDIMDMEDKESWIFSMDENMDTLRNNDIWDLILFPGG